VRRRGVILIVLGAVLAGCAGGQHAVSPPRHHHRRHHHHRTHQPPRPATIANLVVTVVDGDGLAPVRGARVAILRKHERTSRHGRAVIRGPRRRLVVRVSARGYTPVRLRLDFQQRKQTIRIYQPKLQWPLYGATPARTQAQPNIKLRPPFRLVWSRSMGALIEFPAVVWDGVAYVGDIHSAVHAVSMRNGRIVWSHRTPGSPRMASSPGVYGDELVYHTMGGGVYVLDRTSGKDLWSWNAGAAIEPSPLIRDGIDYFGTAGGSVDALDLRTHKLRWSRSLGSKITSSVALAGGRLFVGDYAGHIWALSPATGATRWVGQVNGKVYGTPAVSQRRVFVPSSTGDSLTAFTTSGRYLWRVTTGNYVYSSPAVWRGRVCFGSYNGTFYGVSAATGRVAWRVYTGGAISGAAVIVDGVAYAGSFSHRIFGVDVRTGRSVLTFRHGAFVPVSGDGARLLLHGFSRLYAVEPRRHHPHHVRHHRRRARHRRHR
jgi:outer membrane protein assembly factor BamB